MSTGQAVVAMLLNGLGFVNQRLYLVSRFFENKPVERLIGPGIEASHLNDDRLGRALDALHEHGLTALFASIASSAMQKLGHKLFHLTCHLENLIHYKRKRLSG